MFPTAIRKLPFIRPKTMTRRRKKKRKVAAKPFSHTQRIILVEKLSMFSLSS